MPFRDIIGHRRLVGLVARSINRGTLPPSLILAGPAGVGKRLLALATAQALNCPAFARGEHERATARQAHEGVEPRAPTSARLTSGRATVGKPSPHLRSADIGPSYGGQAQPPEVDACGTCSTCTRIARGVHPDVLLVEPGDTGSIKIDQVREIVDRAGYRPFEGRRRVVIIDEADALVPQAQNALLKTLEEPPPSSVFLLVTSRPDMLLATVRSRCPRLPFRPLDADDVAAALMRQGRTGPEARAIAASADGSIGRALAASGDDFVEAREAATRVLTQVAGIRDPRRRLDSAKDLLAKTGAGGARDREQLAVNLRAMASLLRDAELLSTRADSCALANPDVQPALEGLTAFHGERGIRAFTAVDQALVALERNAGVKVVADWLVLQL